MAKSESSINLQKKVLQDQGHLIAQNSWGSTGKHRAEKGHKCVSNVNFTLFDQAGNLNAHMLTHSEAYTCSAWKKHLVEQEL